MKGGPHTIRPYNPDRKAHPKDDETVWPRARIVLGSEKS